MIEADVSTHTNKANNRPASSARSGRSSFDWQVQPGQETHPLVESVLTGLHRLRETERPFNGGAARAAAVHASEEEPLLTLLAFGDEAFDDLVLLLQSLKFVNVLASEDPATGLDAVFVPHAV
ncbi:MAG: hypothetical protein JF606_27335 [Burkholderiales bacterium]|jgi:hypothetical protein|nr:hypothetical protein [Burkholderiales bacterium]